MRQIPLLLVMVLLAADVDTASGQPTTSQPTTSGSRGKPRLWIKTPLKAKLEVKQFSGWEAMGKGFQYEAKLRPEGKLFDPKRLLGLKVTVVIGPPGKKADTDRHGRVRVRFHWERPGPRWRGRSAWIRVAQPLPARPDFKGQLVPRGGQEVVVHFLEGDPDRPIIAGILHRGPAPGPKP